MDLHDRDPCVGEGHIDDGRALAVPVADQLPNRGSDIPHSGVHLPE
jgi:hypothetical protein